MYSKEPIVIVDDDTDDHYIIKKIKERIGFENELIFFPDGKQVLEYLQTTKQKPFIILCDINMPVKNGLELRREIDKDEHLRKKSIPFVFFSTAATRAQVEEAYNLTVQGFFLKEQSFIETERTLKLILDYWDKCKHPNGYSGLF